MNEEIRKRVYNLAMKGEKMITLTEEDNIDQSKLLQLTMQLQDEHPLFTKFEL